MEELQRSEKIQTTVKERKLAVEVQPNKPSQSPSASQCGAVGVNDGRGAAVIRFPAWRMEGALTRSLRWLEVSLCCSSLSFFFTRFRLVKQVSLCLTNVTLPYVKAAPQWHFGSFFFRVHFAER